MLPKWRSNGTRTTNRACRAERRFRREAVSSEGRAEHTAATDGPERPTSGQRVALASSRSAATVPLRQRIVPSETLTKMPLASTMVRSGSMPGSIKTTRISSPNAV